MVRYFLKKRGVTLIEIALSVTVFIILVSAVLILASGQRQRAKVERVLTDLKSLVDASGQYHNRYGNWPGAISDLKPEFISAAVSKNPFGNNYSISSTSSQVTVSTLVPAGQIDVALVGPEVVITNQGSNDLISMSQPVPGRNRWRLKYDKKKLYGE